MARFAEVLASAGVKVVIGARRVEKLRAVEQFIASAGGEALAFHGETLNEAIAELSRQTGFELADAELGEMRVGGYVVADPEAFIALVSTSLNLKARRGAKGV